MHQKHLGACYDTIIGPHPQEFLIHYVRGRDLRICILNKFLGEADDAGPGPTVQSFIQHILSTHYVEGTNLGIPNRTRQFLLSQCLIFVGKQIAKLKVDYFPMNNSNNNTCYRKAQPKI